MQEDTIININEQDNLSGDVSQWTPYQVGSWLRQMGYQEYELSATNSSNPVSGDQLLAMSSADLQGPPFNVRDRAEAEHLQSCIETLRKSQLSQFMKKFERNEVGKVKDMRNGFLNNSTSKLPLVNGCIPNGYQSGHAVESEETFTNARTPLIAGDSASTSEQYPTEILKTIVALAYMFFGFVMSVTTLSFVHERVPTMEEEPPLPDIFFDLVPTRFQHAFTVSEVIGMILSILALAVTIFHRHRFIIARRVFFIVGTLYLYRCVTMYVTTLPVPGIHFKCATKTHHNASVMFMRAVQLLFGGGLTITGAHHLCGDYLYSGHTIVLVISYLTIYEYTPRRWWLLHWTCWMLSSAAAVCILLAHDHYTVDVVVSYVISTRLFWTYHTLCNVQSLKEGGNANLLSRTWWFPVFRYFEGNVRATVPRTYGWPLPWPRSLAQSFNGRRSPVKGV